MFLVALAVASVGPVSEVLFALPVPGFLSGFRKSGGDEVSPTRSEVTDFSFGYDQASGRAEFSSERIISLMLGNVPDGAPTAYLKDADRIVQAAWPQRLTGSAKLVEPGRFMLPLPAVSLIMLKWKPEVFLRVSFEPHTRALRIQSDGVNLGLSDWGWGGSTGSFKEEFQMRLSGKMADTSKGERGQLSVDFRMDITGRLPGPLKALVPERALRSAADKVCQVTLGFVLEKLSDRIADDYRKWEAESYKHEEESHQLPSVA